MIPERRRLPYALLLSLLTHVWLLTLTIGGQGRWLPHLSFPWPERRIEVPDLRVVLVPPAVKATEPFVAPVPELPQQSGVEQPVGALTVKPPLSRAPASVRIAPSVVPEAAQNAEVSPKAETSPGPIAPAGPTTPKAPLRANRSRKSAPAPSAAPAVIAVERTDENTWTVPVTPMVPPMIAAAPSAPISETPMASLPDIGAAAPAQSARLENESQAAAQQAAKGQESARQESEREESERRESARLAAAQEAQRQEVARREEAARAEVARREAERQDAARLAAAQEAQRQEAARREEAARAEAVRREAARQEAAQQAAEREAQRQEVARQEEAARIEATRRAAEREAARQAAEREAQRQEAARVEAARREAERKEAERAAAAQEAQRQEIARGEEAARETARAEAARREEAEKREARLRAIGRQLDEEAAQREMLSNPARQRADLPLSLSTARRVRLWGRTHPNAELIRYAEAWERKIQLNTPIETVREVAKRPHTDPLVTVAVRSDGSVESVTFVLSSGTAEVDDAIRRIVKSHEHYQAFPTDLARDVDVIEIRRTWYFDTAVRFY